jgi:fructose-1,6-bisphosphatase/inositol monophosphatase family enzyme
MAADLESRRRVAEAAAKAAGAIHLRYRQGAIEYETKNGDRRDLVSRADTEGQDVARAIIEAAFPGELIIGEEDGATAGQLDRLIESAGWVIDPLDGTFQFLHGFPDFSATLAYVEAGRPVAGAVYAPVLDELFSAAHGLGASLNGEPISVSKRRGLADSLVNVWLGLEDNDEQVARAAEVQRRAFAMRSFGGSALVLAYVACGRYDLYYAGENPRMGPWDIAAGALLVTEAGGIVSRGDGRAFALAAKDVAAAADPATLDELRAIVGR